MDEREEREREGEEGGDESKLNKGKSVCAFDGEVGRGRKRPKKLAIKNNNYTRAEAACGVLLRPFYFHVSSLKPTAIVFVDVNFGNRLNYMLLPFLYARLYVERG